MKDDKVYVVSHTLVSQGKSLGHYNTDMIYKDGIPQLVFEWRGAPDSETEHYLVPLDPAFLHPLPGWKGVDYMYERPITDPRQHN